MPKKKRRKTPKTIAEYRNNIKEYSAFAPALKKYKRRKTLKPGEKAFITKIENIINSLTGPNRSLIPLGKKEQRFIKRSSPQAVIGNGVRAMSFRKLDSGARAKLVGNELRIVSKNRDWHHTAVTPAELDIYLERGENLINERAGRTVALWSANGGNYRGFTRWDSQGDNSLMKRIIEYFTAYSRHDDWLLGFAYYDIA